MIYIYITGTKDLIVSPRCSRLVLVGLLVNAWAATEVSVAAEPAEPLLTDLDAECGPIRSVSVAEGAQDYRLRNSDPAVAKGMQNLEKFHVQLARAELMGGRANFTAKDNLDFTLKSSPNHAEALRLLVQYDLLGGRQHKFPPTKCYFSWARTFAPDDGSVYVVAGYYFFKKHDLERAEVWWQRALAIAPDSADANYNLGLLYIQRGDYEKASVYARKAYAAGFPLTGLRDALKRSGHW